jgi:sulfite dehydrogenase (quinone) subunit SoeC
MNPAWSVVFFTVLAGFGQGLAVTLAFAVLIGVLPPEGGFLTTALIVAIALTVAGLACSFLHLGRPLRAWRAAAMWRTSWLSREVIVMPVFVGWLCLWWIALHYAAPSALQSLLLPAGAIVLALALWLCTGMIYACIRFIQEWAHPVTLWIYLLTGLSSGLVLAGCLALFGSQPKLLAFIGPWAFVATLFAGGVRMRSLRRNAQLAPRSTLRSATGIRAARVHQISMGMSGGSFNTREFFHGLAEAWVRSVKRAAVIGGFGLPLAAIGLAIVSGFAWLWVLACAAQLAGLIADRWLFFAQARHPQNLYYQRFG